MTKPAQFDAVVFDAYGTLLDVHAAMARHAPRLGESWRTLAAEWRVKQLEYSWIDSMTAHGARRDFAACTADALDYVLARHGVDPALRGDLLAAYERLDAYPEVPAMLAALRAGRLRLAILSNGTPAMLAAACAAAGVTDLLDAVISVEQAGIFKPAPPVYALVHSTLEIGLIGDVIGRLGPGDLDALEATLFAMRRKAEAGEAFPAEDQAFHARLFACLGNRVLLSVLDVFWRAFHRAADLQREESSHDAVRTWRDHDAIFRAVFAGDAEAARRKLDLHYDGIRDRLMKNGPPP